MAIITISRGSYTFGMEVAKKTAEMLGYEHVSREILLEASQFFNVSEMELMHSVHDAPNILERVTHGREKYISYIRAALLTHVKKDNIVYFGHAGHLLLPDSRHVLKVRVIADMEARIDFICRQDGLTRTQAIARIEKEDKNRSLWTQYLYKVDLFDPSIYDIVININKMTIDDASEAICSLARSETYHVTEQSLKEIEDMAITSLVEVSLEELCHPEVTTKNGMVHIKARTHKIKKHSFMNQKTQDTFKNKVKAELAIKISDIVKKIDGVKDVVCDIDSSGYA